MEKPMITNFQTLGTLLIQRYERYLPTAFDESMSLVQKVNKVIIHLNQIGELANDVADQWNKVMEWFLEEGLTEAVENQFNRLVESEEFVELVQVALDELTIEVREKISDLGVNVKTYGAKGDGVTDDTQAFITALQENSHILVPEGYTFIVNEILLPNKNIKISGGGTIRGTLGTFIFKQRKRETLTILKDLIFTGYSTAFYYHSDDSVLPFYSQRFEFLIDSCKFLYDSPDPLAGAYRAVPAIDLYGSREGNIDNCYFAHNEGIRTEFVINTNISNCHFKNCKHMVLSKLGSEGLRVTNAVALGCLYGVLCERTTGVQIIGCMIDYCDIPIYLKGATDVMISNNYISTRTIAPALEILAYTDGFNGYNYHISNNVLKANYIEGFTQNQVVVLIKDVNQLVFDNNTVKNYNTAGIEYANLTHAIIEKNMIRPKVGSGVNSILASLNDSATVILNFNNVVQPISRSITSKRAFFRNSGHLTENSGEGVITTGNSSVVVTHGLAVTPSKNDIKLTPTTPNTAGIGYYVSAVTSTTFTITTTANVAGTTAFAWSIN